MSSLHGHTNHCQDMNVHWDSIRIDHYTDFTYHCYTCMHFISTYHGYTCMSLLHVHVTATRACHVYISLLHMHVMLPCDSCLYGFSIFLSYGSPWLLHVLLFHAPVFMIYDCCLLLIRVFLLLDMRAVDMRYVGSSHLLFPFSVYCSWYLVHVILFLILVILFYAINRAQVQLSCYPYHVQ